MLTSPLCTNQAAAEAQLNDTTKELLSLRGQLTSDRDKLYKRRQELVSGKALPTSEELAACDADSDAQHAQHHQQQGTSAKGVPHFWLTALMNQVGGGCAGRRLDGGTPLRQPPLGSSPNAPLRMQDSLAEEISSRDKQALVSASCARR